MGVRVRVRVRVTVEVRVRVGCASRPAQPVSGVTCDGSSQVCGKAP